MNIERVKYLIEDRKRTLEYCLSDVPSNERTMAGGYIDPRDDQMNKEIEFLDELLEEINGRL